MAALPAPERKLSRRLGGLGLLAVALALLAPLDAYVDAGPAFGLSALGAWLLVAA